MDGSGYFGPFAGILKARDGISRKSSAEPSVPNDDLLPLRDECHFFLV